MRGKKCFAVREDEFFIVSGLSWANAIVLEHAFSKTEVEKNMFEDGKLFYMEEMNEKEMFEKNDRRDRRVRRNGKRRLFCNCIQDTIVLVCKIEIGGRCKSNMITHDNQLLQINRKYWDYIMRNLIEDRYITCETEKVWGKRIDL